MLELDYDPRLDGQTLARLEEAAAAVGLPLERLELIGQDAAVARAFVRAVDDGRAEAMLDDVDWDGLDATRTSRHAEIAAWVDLLAPESATREIGE